MKKIKLLCIIAIIVLHYVPVKSSVPGYVYTYDASGNRMTRTYQMVSLKKNDTTSNIFYS